jgi:WhiB family redox-sensing transcriptional regulator
MKVIITIPKWVDSAACTEDDAALFFPEAGRGAKALTRRNEREAKAICARCPVSLLCLEYGMGDDWGIYGGLNAGERRRLSRQQGRGVA